MSKADKQIIAWQAEEIVRLNARVDKVVDWWLAAAQRNPAMNQHPSLYSVPDNALYDQDNDAYQPFGTDQT